jgi:hypothetical protein
LQLPSLRVAGLVNLADVVFGLLCPALVRT